MDGATDKMTAQEVNQHDTAGSLNKLMQHEVRDIYESLKSLQKGMKFPSFKEINLPMVLVLGNHSSGKSSFINYMLGQQIQKTGRAPTDSTFTVIKGGSRSERLDGFALSRSSELCFKDLGDLFGSNFLSQLELKVVKNSDLLDSTGMLIIDSPGMIDPPGLSKDRTDMDRGYDFKGVVRWFADHSDVILVLFDPDKPGTTFETLDILVSSLGGNSSKVRLLLNKVDDFKSVHDFARAYGALCWNLSKIIPRKDLPFIYTMYIPNTSKDTQTRELIATGSKDQTLSKILASEFDSIRDEIIEEVTRAPDRSTDNLLNDLKTSCSRLRMHCHLLNACREEYLALERNWKILNLSVGFGGLVIAAYYLARTTSSPATQILTQDSSEEWKKSWAKQLARTKIVLSSVCGVFATLKMARKSLKTKRKDCSLWLPDVFRRQYAEHLSQQDRACRETYQLFDSISDGLGVALHSFNLKEIPKMDLEQDHLLNVLQLQIPKLDRAVRNRAGADYKFLASEKSQDSKVLSSISRQSKISY